MRKKPSFRAIAQMKKDLRELRSRVHDLAYGSYPGTVVSRINLGEVTWAQIQTAHKLGHLLILRESDPEHRTASLHAVRKAEL